MAILPPGEPGYGPGTYSPTAMLAPIQEFRHRDGTWTATGPVYLMEWQGWHPGGLGPHNWPATAPATVEIIENGPLRAKVRVHYVGLRQGYYQQTTEGTGGPPLFYYVRAIEAGYLTCTITVEAGQSTIQIEHKTNTRATWTMNMNTGVNADMGRMKTNDTTSAAQGHDYEGNQRLHDSANACIEMEFNLYEAGKRISTDWNGVAWPVGDEGVWWSTISHWVDLPIDTGIYFYFYNSAAGSSGNIWGIIQGRSSQFTRWAYMGPYGKPETGTPTEFGFYAQNSVELTLGGVGHESKYTFSIYLGTKADIPVNASDQGEWHDIYPHIGFQPYPINVSKIAKAHTLVAGAAQAWKQMYQSLEFPDPVGGFPGMHLERAEIEALIANLEADQGPGSYYEELYNSDTTYQDVWRAFANIDGLETKAREVLTYCTDFIHVGTETLVNKGSHMHLWWFFWQGGLRFQNIVIRAMAMISLDQYRPFLTAAEKLRLKAILAAVGHITWDDDYVPSTAEAFLHNQWTYGTANAPQQWSNQRSQFGITLGSHPQFAGRFDEVYASALNTFNTKIVASGAVKDCPHYAGTYIVPLFDVFRQLFVNGYVDVFAPASPLYSKIVLLCEWLIQLTTPPQVRFKKTPGGPGLRKLVCYGNGASEANSHGIAIISGLKNHNPTLSKRLAWVWVATNKSLFSFYSCSGLKITPTVLTQDPMLGDADFADSFTVFRCGWGTADESAVFIQHGSANVDHCTHQQGSPNLHLLGAPITVSFGQTYDPIIFEPWMHASTYVPESELDALYNRYPLLDWSTYTALDVDCNDHSRYFLDTYTHSFAPLRCDLTCNFITNDAWQRRVTFYRDDLACPVVRFRDDNNLVSGDSVYSLQLMATGVVTLPDGSTQTPTETPTLVVTNGATFAVPNGGCIKFVGQWGVSFEVYYFGPAATGVITAYGHNYHPNTEEGEYTISTGQPFTEKQFILRIKTAGPCDTVVVPYRVRPAGLNVTSLGGGNLNLFTTAGGDRSLPA